MQYTRLGKSELTVSRICMGCMGFGDAQSGQHSWTLDEEHSREIIRYGLEKGINFFEGYFSPRAERTQHFGCGAFSRQYPLDDRVCGS